MAIITKNEEKMLPDCLRSVSFADDIVVVDSGSTDRTVEIAKGFGCRVFIEEWKGDGPQKNSAVDKCMHNWVLVLDADERVPPETGEEILRIINDPKGADAYSFPRKNFFHGKWIRHCDWWPDRIVRLVKKDKGRSMSITHSRWATTGVLGEADVPIEHRSFESYSDMLKVVDGRTDETARELYNEGRRANPLAPVSNAIGMFLKIYILKLGFLDGFDGLVIAFSRAEGVFYKYAKLIEIQRHKPKT